MSTYPFVDLPSLAAEFDALADVVAPMTSDRLTVARSGIASAIRRLTLLDRVFAKVELAIEIGDPGSDFDFAVRDLLGVSSDLSAAQGQVSAAAALLVRTNIALTAAATIAACENGSEVH